MGIKQWLGKLLKLEGETKRIYIVAYVKDVDEKIFFKSYGEYDESPEEIYGCGQDGYYMRVGLLEPIYLGTDLDKAKQLVKDWTKNGNFEDFVRYYEGYHGGED